MIYFGYSNFNIGYFRKKLDMNPRIDRNENNNIPPTIYLDTQSQHVKAVDSCIECTNELNLDWDYGCVAIRRLVVKNEGSSNKNMAIYSKCPRNGRLLGSSVDTNNTKHPNYKLYNIENLPSLLMIRIGVCFILTENSFEYLNKQLLKT